jgi:hypothetical protein
LRNASYQRMERLKARLFEYGNKNITFNLLAGSGA